MPHSPAPLRYIQQRRLLALCSTLALASCHDDSAGPSDEPLRPSFSSVSFSATLSPTASDTDVGPISLGTIPSATLVEIKVEGLLARAYSNADIWYNSSTGEDKRGQSAGDWDAAGHFIWSYFRCWGNVKVSIGAGVKNFCDMGHVPTKSIWADTMIMSGAATAMWLKGPLTGGTGCDVAGKPPCFTYSGTHTVTINSAAADLSLAASRYVVYPGNGSVTFTSVASPNMWGRHTIPVHTQRWTWTPDSAGAPTPLCANAASCTWSPPTSGTMALTAMVNGVQKTKSAHIRKLCSPTGDPILDSLPVIDFLKQLLAAAGDYTVSGNQSSRREIFGVFQCDQDGNCSVTPTPGPNACSASPPTLRLDTIPGIVGVGHPHPFRPVRADSITGLPFLLFPGADSLPVECRSDPSLPGTRGSAPGPSAADYDLSSSYNDAPTPYPLRQWVIDPDNIYSIPVGTMSDSARRAGTLTIPRSVGSCMRW